MRLPDKRSRVEVDRRRKGSLGAFPVGEEHPIRDAPVKQRDPDRGDSRRDTRNVWAIVFRGHLPGKYFTNPDSEVIDNHPSG